ncbi:MAG: PIN domain-containing protein [Acidimicrobiia bacterium]
MSAVVVDTGVFSAPLLARRVVGKSLQQQYQRHLIGRQLVIATQTVAELHYGAEVAGWGPHRRERLARLVDSAFLVPPDERMCREFGKLRARLRRLGHPLYQEDHTGDLWIATTASHLGLPLVAHDRIFVDCPGLDVRTEL